MIILVLAVVVVLTFATWAFIKKTPVRLTVGYFMFLVLAATVASVTLSFTNHLGMKKVTKVETHEIFSANPKSPAGMLITQRLGTKANNYVLVYSNSADAKKPSTHGVPDKSDIAEALKKSTTYRKADVEKATAKVTTTRWEWKNGFYRVMFGIGGQGGAIAKQRTMVTVPKDTWVVVTAAQAKELAAKQKNAGSPAAQAAQQAAMKQAVMAKVQAYMKAHPTATPAQIQTYTHTATAEIAAEAMEQMLAK